jgi:hypothetical protein
MSRAVSRGPGQLITIADWSRNRRTVQAEKYLTIDEVKDTDLFV